MGFNGLAWAEMPHERHAHGAHEMGALYGSYPMTRESSGTSWQPEATPMIGMHFMSKTTPGESAMVSGFAMLIDDHQSGPRGGNKTFSTNMLMWMGRKEIERNIFGIRAMVSLDPLMGKRGYPLLFQVGETADGINSLVDRQHPHDAFMELAATYSRILTEQSSVFLYLALPGEPALGPPTFMNRYSSMDIPEAPLTHHKLDATHTSFGVMTLGYIYQDLKLEGSLFNGKEPDQFRWNIEAPRLNSRAVRLSYNPIPALAFQISNAHLKAPEQISPNVDVNRTTASVLYDHALCGDNHWQTTIAWGKNKNEPGRNLDGYLLESALNFSQKHTVFGRLERTKEDELFEEGTPLFESIFTINKLSLGYIYDFSHIGQARIGVGGLISAYKFPDALKPFYGRHPFSYMVFGRIRL